MAATTVSASVVRGLRLLLPLVAEELLRLAARGADQALSVDDHGGIRGGLEEVVEETLAPAQALQRLFALPLGALERAPSLRVAQLALDRGAESGQPVLEEEVVGARLQNLHGVLLADGPRDDHEGSVEAALLPKGQGVGGLETGHVVVRNDEVEARAVEGGGHRLRSVDPLPGDFPAAALHLADDELRVFLAVIDDQRPEWLAHAHGPVAASWSPGRPGRPGI
jgi:hypothetical protein